VFWIMAVPASQCHVCHIPLVRIRFASKVEISKFIMSDYRQPLYRRRAKQHSCNRPKQGHVFGLNILGVSFMIKIYATCSVYDET